MKKQPTKLGDLCQGDVVGMDFPDGTKGTATITSVRAVSWIKSANGQTVRVNYVVDDGTGEERSCVASSEDQIYVLKDGK